LQSSLFSSLRFRAPHLGIDVGTARTVISVPGDGVLLDEPTLVALDRGTGRVFNRGEAVGNIAGLMQGRTPDSVQMVWPVRRGAVADIDVCAAMLSAFLRKSARRGWGRPRVLMAVSNALTPVERQALLAVVSRAGVRRVSLTSKSLVAGLAAGLPIAQPVASMVCDLGGGTTEIAVLCLGDVVVSERLRVAGEDLDIAIGDHLRRKHRLCVGKHVLERVKIEGGTAVRLDRQQSIEVGGRDALSGLPRRIELPTDELREALQVELKAIVSGVERVLGTCPAEMAADLMENGMVLVGGAAQLRGLELLLTSATGMPVRVAEDPQLSVARGLAICLETPDGGHGLIRQRDVA
jgi:rod shape-determining protein MreB and related proteins